MSDRSHLNNLMPDFGEYSLESVLDNYRKRATSAPAIDPAQEPARSAEAIAQRSRQIVMEALGDTLNQYKPPEVSPLEDPFVFDDTPASTPEPEAGQAPEEAAEPEHAPRRPIHISPDGIITVNLDIPQPETPPEQAREPKRPRREKKAKKPDRETRPKEPARAETPRRPDPEPEPEEPVWEEPSQSGPEPEPKGPVWKEPSQSDPELVLEEPVWEEPSQSDPEPELEDPIQEKPRQSAYERPREDHADRQSDREARPAAAGFLTFLRRAASVISERILQPLVRMAATVLAKRQMQKAEAAKWPDPVEYRQADELSPKRASKFYDQQTRPLRFRLRVSFFLCVVLGWIALGLPMAGSLGRSLDVQAGVSLVLLLTVMMATLDILAAGVRQLFDLHPGAEALATLAALLSVVDAVMVMLGYSDQMPFCAVGAAALACALWGERFSCVARARTLRAASMSKTPSVVSTDESGRYLFRAQQSIEGAVRRTEQADFCQVVYAVAAPVFLALCLLLSVLASLDGKGAYFLHTLSALLAVSASFTAFLCFPLPYALTARKLQSSGVAIIGYPGCADIGKTKRVVISDDDIFPPGTMRLSGINILEGTFVDKVISCTTSLLAAAGSGVTAVFMELVTRRGYSLVTPAEFKCHEGGGLSANIGGETILVGSAGFMNLMGIRLPQNLSAKNAVCTAISGELVGVFTLEYIPVTSVQEALVTLLQGRTQPVFAIRDFNITPLMIRQLFRMPTDNFNFPTFRDRYRITAPKNRAAASAVVTRTGMGPMVDAAVSGRKLYNTCRVSTIISLTGTVIGLLTMFLLCRAGSYDTATAGNVLSYMVLWALPVMILSVGQSR